MSGIDAGPLARGWSEFRDHLAAKHPELDVGAMRGAFYSGASIVVKAMLVNTKGLSLIRMRMELTDYIEEAPGNDRTPERPSTAEPNSAHKEAAA